MFRKRFKSKAKKDTTLEKKTNFKHIIYNPYTTKPIRHWEDELLRYSVLNKSCERKSNIICDQKEFKDILSQDKNIKYIQFTCIDPGTVKLAFRVERRYYDKSGLLYVKECVYEMFNPKTYAAKNETTHSDAVRWFLKSYKDVISKSHFLLVEHTFKTNSSVNRICQCIVDFYCDIAETSSLYPYVVEVDDKLKSTMLKVQRSVDKDKWGPEYASYILRSNGKDESSKILLSLSKARGKTDLSDVVNIIEAYILWKNYTFISTPKIENILKCRLE